MKSSIIGSFLLILLVVSCATAEKVDQTSEIESRIVAENGASNGDKFHKKRSITNIMKLLLGGNVPPNHPLVKESEPKSWNLAPQILASLPGSGYGLGGGWGPTPAQKLQQIFETKAKILPYTGQVASGLIGIGGVKGEILKQIHGLSTSVIANVAAEAAQKAVRTALAAQAVTNQVAHATPHILNAAGQAIHSAKAAKGELLRPLIPHANGYANFGVGLGHHHDLHQGWHSTQQNSFALPNSGSAGDKTPGDLPGPPYSSQSVQTQLYQAPAYQNSYSAAASAVPSTSSPDYGQAAMYNMQQNGQQQESASEPQQTQDYNELVNQITNDARNRLNAIDYSTLAQQLQLQQQQQQRPGQNYGPPKPQGYNPSPPPPSQIYNPISTNNANTTSFHSAVSDESWRKYSGNVQETPSILSSIAQIAASSISAYKSLSTIADVSTTAARKSSTVAGDATLSGSAPTPTGFAGQYQPSPHQLGGFSSRPHYAQSPQPIRHYQTQSPHLYAASSSSRAQYVPHNVAKYSPQALRNTPNAHRLHDASVKLGSNLLRRPTATIQSGHYDAGVGSSLGSLSRFSPQPTRSYVDQTTRSFGAGRAIHTHAGPTARNFVGASRTYPGSIAQTSPFTVGGQTQNLFGSASNFAPTSAGGQRYASPRENREQSAYSLSGYRSPYLTSHLHSASSSSTNHNYHQLAPSPSEQSLNYELPPTTSSHSQYNNIGQSSLGGRSVLTAKKGGLIPTPTDRSDPNSPVSFTLLIPVNGPATVTRDDSRPQFQSRISERFPSSKERSVEDISLTNEEVEDSSEKLPRLHLHQTATFPKGGSVSAASSRSSSEVVSPPQNRISSGESTNRSFKPQSPTYPEQDPEFTPPSRDNYFMSDRMDQQEPSSQEDTSQEHQIYDLYQHHPVMPMEQPEANHQSREKISKEEVELKREAIFKIPDRRVPPATKAVKEMTERSSKSQKELQDEERKKSLSELIQQLIKLLK
ncbi:uncharacterized protein LOC110862616 isoform X1 [Folsomia candida]|uniref:uncharacterized protein LOC110862616 isoform X1 n=1 Tax=Folsomia candida TaxID=158441 RepID=UPI001604AD9B|nr:uncharacterized protein LOC110862616 isoform X1 [Folsomia candida]